ncbi:putative holin-like toxin [Lentilactobacillus sp. IMAU92037]|nr:putative holin-like toxin [Lentilactobacillus dabitei]
MSVSDALQLAIGTGLLIINLIVLVVELIKSQQKK